MKERDSQMNNILTVDIGGTEIKYALMIDEKLKYKSTKKTYIEEEGFHVFKRLEEIIDIMRAKHEIKGIAISTAGMVDASLGKIIYANDNLPNYTGTMLSKLINEKYNLPCSVENDVNSAALGEQKSQNLNNFIMITVGTGVGGSVVLNNNVYKGASDCAGEIGYMLVKGKPIETFASTKAMVNSLSKKLNISDLDGKKIFARAKQGDVICIEAIDELCENIAEIMTNCACLLNPEAIVLGGGVMEQEEYLKPIIHKHFKEKCHKPIYEATQVRFANLGNDAGMVGAYQHFKNLNS